MSLRRQMVELLTNEVSFRGVFVRTGSPPAPRQLVKLAPVLPDQHVVAGHAMVVHVASRPDPELDLAEAAAPLIPGIGLQFWGPIERDREWAKFIHELKHRQRAGIPAAKATDKVRRASERFKLAIEVVF